LAGEVAGGLLAAGPVGSAMRRSPSRAASRRDEPGNPEALAARRRRAVEEPLDVRLRSREPYVELEVRNPIHRTSYRVLFPEYPGRASGLCTCTDFARRGLGTCKHLEAGWSWLAGLPELPEPTGPAGAPVPCDLLWQEIDRRLQRWGRSPPRRIRDLEDAGAVLFEEGPAPSGPPGANEAGGAGGRSRAGRTPSRPTSRARP
jgi:hypothetical protein